MRCLPCTSWLFSPPPLLSLSSLVLWQWVLETRTPTGQSPNPRSPRGGSDAEQSRLFHPPSRRCGGVPGAAGPRGPRMWFMDRLGALSTPVLAHHWPVLEQRDWWERTGSPPRQPLGRSCLVQEAEKGKKLMFPLVKPCSRARSSRPPRAGRGPRRLCFLPPFQIKQTIHFISLIFQMEVNWPCWQVPD